MPPVLLEFLSSAFPVLFLAAAFFLPGTAALIPLRLGWIPAISLGPAVTVALVALATVVLDAVGVRWNLGPVAALLVLPPVVSYLISRRIALRVPLMPPARPGSVLGLGAGLLVSGALISGALLDGMGSLGTASQGWDPIFHVNALAWIQESGRATPWSFNPIYGKGQGTYYPAGWHGIVSLFPGGVVEAANASSLVIGAMIWPIGIAFLAAVILPRHRTAWAVAPVLAAAFVSFPSSQLVRSGQWPNGLATALVPGAVALILLLIPGRPAGAPTRSRQDRVLLAIIASVVVAGSVAAHPSAVFALGVAVFPFLVARGVPAYVSGLRRRRRRTLLATAVAAVFCLAVAAWLMRSPVLTGVMNYPRAVRAAVPDSLALAFFDLPQFPALVAPTIDSFNIAVGILVIVGAVLTVAQRNVLPLAAAWLVFVALYVLAAGPENPLRFLVGVWYKDTQRIAPFIAMTGSILAAFAVAMIANLVAGLLARATRSARATDGRPMAAIAGCVAVVLVAAVFAGSSGFRAAHRASVAAHNYVTPSAPGTGVLSSGEQDFIRRAGGLIPQDAVVIGDPFNGETFFYALTRRHVVYTQLGSPSGTAEKALLRASFNRLYDDPGVCDAITTVGATHFYQDAPGASHGSSSVDAWPGFYGVDTTAGFSPVLVEGSRGLYEITGCG